LLGYLAGDGHQGGVSGCLHVATDKLCSKDKSFKKWLQKAAKKDRELEREATKLRKQAEREEKARAKATKKRWQNFTRLINKSIR